MWDLGFWRLIIYDYAQTLRHRLPVNFLLLSVDYIAGRCLSWLGFLSVTSRLTLFEASEAEHSSDTEMERKTQTLVELEGG